MSKINFDNVVKKLKEIKRSYMYIFLLFGLSFLFWYIFSNDLDTESFIFYSVISVYTFDNFIAIFIRLPHRGIPDDYSILASISIRVFLFLFLLFILVHNLIKDNII